MTKTMSKIVLILVVSLTLTICLLIPQLSLKTTTTVLIGSYISLMIISLLANQHRIATLLVMCAIILPVSEFVWAASSVNFIWSEMNYFIENHWLVFSFSGIASYAIVCVIAPVAIMMIIIRSINIFRIQ